MAIPNSTTLIVMAIPNSTTLTIKIHSHRGRKAWKDLRVEEVLQLTGLTILPIPGIYI